MRPSDVEELALAHPAWVITVAWVSRASGPDARQLAARREGVEVRAWTEAELSVKIAAEEMAHGWPCALGGPPVCHVLCIPPHWCQGTAP